MVDLTLNPLTVHSPQAHEKSAAASRMWLLNPKLFARDSPIAALTS